MDNVNQLKLLPPQIELETKKVLKQLANAHRYLAELKGIAASIPNEAILIDTLSLQEAKDSSEVENIVTTHDDMFKADLFKDLFLSPAAKEVSRYSSALRDGYFQVKNTGLITTNLILSLQETIVLNKAGFRKVPGTTLKNDKTGETIYTPPQDYNQIIELMNNLEQFINDDLMCDVDPLIKMAVMHYQFEAIHPFYDGNGRTGRILNVLYLVKKGLLNIPILYLSRYIIQNKTKYYQMIQALNEIHQWEPWLLYMLEAIEITSRQSIETIKNIKTLMMDYKQRIKKQLPNIYSQDLLNNIFRHPYTKIELMKDELHVIRITATKYLNLLSDSGFLEKHKIGKHNYYVNRPLANLLMNIPDMPE